MLFPAFQTLRSTCANHRGCQDCAAGQRATTTDMDLIRGRLIDAGMEVKQTDNLTLWVEGGIEFWFDVDGTLISVVRG